MFACMPARTHHMPTQLSSGRISLAPSHHASYPLHLLGSKCIGKVLATASDQFLYLLPNSDYEGIQLLNCNDMLTGYT